MKPNENAATSAAVGCPIATAGEVFADGAMIELVGGVHPTQPLLMLWDGSTEIIGPVVEYDGQLYTSALIESTILRELTPPHVLLPAWNHARVSDGNLQTRDDPCWRGRKDLHRLLLGSFCSARSSKPFSCSSAPDRRA